jgi:hypothetical protein
MRILRLGLFGSAFLAAACGGKVVFETGGGQGGGPPSTVSVSISSTGAVAPTGVVSVVATTGTGMGDQCTQYCAALGAKGCGGGDCVARCESALGSSCGSIASMLVSCLQNYIGGAPGCLVAGCTQARTDFALCSATALGCMDALVFDDTSGSCGGKGLCGGGEPWVECDGAGNCTCHFDSSTVGSCHETGPFVCDITQGCCGAFDTTGG